MGKDYLGGVEFTGPLPLNSRGKTDKMCGNCKNKREGGIPRNVSVRLMQTAKKITARGFRPYGKVIEYPGKGTKGTARNLWRIVHRSTAKTGWRVAYLVLRDKALRRLECHPFSDETFEPLRGKALLFVRTRTAPEAECFLLDRPVVLRKGIWHGLLTLGDEAEIKITENLNVSCRYIAFPKDKNKLSSSVPQ